MRPIRELADRELEWTQPSAQRRVYELRLEEEVLATLQFRSLFGSFATGVTAEGTWTLKRTGFFRTQVTVHPEGAEREIAVFRNATWSGGGTLELPDGRRYPANTNFWHSTYEFQSESEEPLVRFRSIRGVLPATSAVEITRQGALLAELPWMVLLGWYLVVKMRDDDAGGSGAVAAGG